MYDFETVIDRRNTNSMKWDVAEHELPMWVADMDFQTAPEICAAIAARAAHGVFGYQVIPDAWYQAYMDWWRGRHDFSIQRDCLVLRRGGGRRSLYNFNTAEGILTPRKQGADYDDNVISMG